MQVISCVTFLSTTIAMDTLHLGSTKNKQTDAPRGLRKQFLLCWVVWHTGHFGSRTYHLVSLWDPCVRCGCARSPLHVLLILRMLGEHSSHTQASLGASVHVMLIKLFWNNFTLKVSRFRIHIQQCLLQFFLVGQKFQLRSRFPSGVRKTACHAQWISCDGPPGASVPRCLRSAGGNEVQSCNASGSVFKRFRNSCRFVGNSLATCQKL